MSTDTPLDVTEFSDEEYELLSYLLEEEQVDLAPARIITPRKKIDTLPLSFAQQRLWFLDQLEPGQTAYNISVAIRLVGLLNIEALRKGLNKIIHRHESLRTTFSTKNGQPVQVISPILTLEFSVVDISHLSASQREAEVQRLVTEEAQQPFDLARGPLLRAKLFRLDQTEYVFFLVMHHIISDGWSMGVFTRELTTLYQTYAQGQPVNLTELPIQYADFAIWQREWLQDEILEEQLSYWKQQLGGNLPVLALPTDYPRPAKQTFNGNRQRFELTEALTGALKTLSLQEKATLFMTLLAAFNILLYRYAGQDDILVGTPIANRNQDEIEALIGFFVNTLVFRTRLVNNPSFQEVVQQVRRVALEAYSHQDLPFEKLVEELQPERSLSYTPLFQVMFILQNAPDSAMELPGLTISSFPIKGVTAKFDLILSMVEDSDKLKGVFEYNTDLFEAATITRMVGHFQTLLEGIVANPKTPISQLSLLTETERHQLLVEWNNPSLLYSKDQCTHQRFEAQVERTPDAVAVIFEDRQLTYQELNQRANQLADYLLSRQVGPDTLVALYVERSLEMVIGILAILKAGGAYLPLDPAYPPKRLAFILEDSQASILLTQSQLVQNLPKYQGHLVCLDTEWNVIANPNSANPNVEISPDDLAYVIYTSGSTGKPKGVLVTHHNVIRLFEATYAWFQFDDKDVWTLFHSYAFDFSVWELWGALLYGGRLVVVPYWVSRSPEAFYELLCQQQVTVLNQTPSAFRQLIQAEDALKSKKDLALRLVIFGGEALELNSLKPWFENHGDQKPHLINMYGITETTVHVTYRPITMADLDASGSSVIGRPIPDLQVYVLDEYQQPVPIGVVGELYVGGAGVTRGYLNRPELTRERFIINPFSDQAEHLYRSGDLVRYLPDGDMEYLGRLDHQVKIRGFRIELDEIEAVLNQYSTVQESVVIVCEDMPDDKRLIAYVVPRQKQTLSISELRKFLQAMLPNYMIPAVFITLDSFPLTPNGKLDRRALPAPGQTREGLQEAFVAPRDELELQIAAIWEQVLGVQPVGIHDNFFDLGGHSLLAVRLLNQIEEIMGKHLPLVALFQAPIVEQLADTLRQEGWTPSTNSLVLLRPGTTRQPFFCVPGNMGNVFTDLGYLARYLGADQPFYGLQDGLHNPIKIESLASHFVDEIRTIQPEGPYFIGGICSGAVIAYEIARQFQAQGERIGLLAMVDPSPLGTSSLSTYFGFFRFLFRRFWRRLGNEQKESMTSVSLAEWSTYLRLKTKVIGNLWAVKHYIPQPYQGQIHLFMAQETFGFEDDPRLEWGELVSEGADVHIIPGSHNTLTGDNDTPINEDEMRVLAETLNTCINEIYTNDNLGGINETSC